jgi:hypothetical protein
MSMREVVENSELFRSRPRTAVVRAQGGGIIHLRGWCSVKLYGNEWCVKVIEKIPFLAASITGSGELILDNIPDIPIHQFDVIVITHKNYRRERVMTVSARQDDPVFLARVLPHWERA